jgi:hypothetical protein
MILYEHHINSEVEKPDLNQDRASDNEIVGQLNIIVWGYLFNTSGNQDAHTALVQ